MAMTCKTHGCNGKVLAKGWCRRCYARMWAREHPANTEEVKRRRREWLKTDTGIAWRQRQVAQARVSYADPAVADKRRASNRKASTGFCPDLFALILKVQGHRCAICQLDFSDDVKACADHDHSTHAPRGVLCDKCNRALGFFGDSLDGLMKAVEYLSNPPADEILRMVGE